MVDATQKKETVPVYDFETGKEVSTLMLNSDIFGVEPKRSVVHQVIVAMQANLRQAVSHVKTKAEVSGGGKKPWKQKGTGHARHGSIRNPQWVGGGKAHGPRNDRNFTQKINKKVTQLATKMMLSDRANDRAIRVVNNFNISEPKTKIARERIERLPNIGKNILLVLDEHNDMLALSVRNLQNISVKRAQDVNARDVSRCGTIIVSEQAVSILENRFGINTA